MKKYIEISDELLMRLGTGKAIEGSMKLDLMTRKLSFNAFNRASKMPGYVRPKDKILGLSNGGWLRASIERFKIFVSANRAIGEERCADELLAQAIELTEQLRGMRNEK